MKTKLYGAMKKLWWWAGFSLITLTLLGGTCGVGTLITVKQILNSKLETTNWNFGMTKWCANGLPVLGDLEKLLNNKTYLVLLQNSNELRPTGGFMGSYVRISTKCEAVQSAKCEIDEIHVQDIYQPDGQLVGHVDPPYPVQEAFMQGWWKLRDSNWDPDIASAAAVVAWFFDQGKEEKIDGIVGVNLTLFNDLLAIFEPIKLVTYPDMITHKNFYGLAQKYAEIDWTPGSTQKRDFLGAVGVALLERIKTAKPDQMWKMGSLVWDQLARGQMWVWMKDDGLQSGVRKMGWTGELARKDSEDYLYVVEANLGANKANCCVQRTVKYDVGSETRKLTLSWKNNNEFENPKPPYFWGGNYIDYVRVIIPVEFEVKSLSVGGRKLRLGTGQDFDSPVSLRHTKSDDMYVVEKRGNLQLVGFWAETIAGKDLTAELEYEGVRGHRYKKIMVKRQPGIGGFNFNLLVNGKIRVSEWVSADVKYGGSN